MTWRVKPTIAFDLSQGVDAASNPIRYRRGVQQEETRDTILAKLADRPGLILGDEVGMGKTWIALLAAVSVAESGGNVLVVTPSRVLAQQWEAQYRDLVKQKIRDSGRADQYNDLLRVYRNYKDLVIEARDQKTATRVFVTSVNLIDKDLRANYRNLGRPPFQLLILDEGHNFKNTYTQKYQLFHRNSRYKDHRDPVLHKQFERMLLLTATPFQLGHHELEGVLRLFYAADIPEKMLRDYQGRIKELLRALDSYQKQCAHFGKRWEHIEHADLGPLEAFVAEPTGPLEPKLRSVYDSYVKLLARKEEVNAGLLDIIIRNVKEVSLRAPRKLPIELVPERQLLFYLTEQLDKSSRDSKTSERGHMSALPSSYARYEEHLEIADSNPCSKVKYYSQLCRSLFESDYRDAKHPKLDEIADFAVERWLNNDKILIFCWFQKTIGDLSAKVALRIKAHIDGKRKIIRKARPNVDYETTSLRDARQIHSLVFRDNLLRVSLMPLLREHGIDGSSFFEFEPKDQECLIQSLEHARSVRNYKVVQAALEYVFFLKFRDRYPDLVPERLADDFEYVIKLGKKLDESDTRIEAEDVLAFVEKRVADGSFGEVVNYPTIWESFADQLEPIKVDIRYKLTAIISDYLTSDEFLYLHLYPHLKAETLSAGEIVSTFLHDHGESDPMHEKTKRFLKFAANLADENLKRLTEDMGYRYNRDKTIPEKTIVEVARGGQGADQKNRTITSFKTPFAPYILISSPVLAEGVDLHTECTTIVHYDHEWNPALLEQKNGRVDRVGSKSERNESEILILYPFLKHTQDQRAHEIVMARASWFNTVMGKDFSEAGQGEDDAEHGVALPVVIQEALRMRLDNEAHRDDDEVGSVDCWRQTGTD